MVAGSSLPDGTAAEVEALGRCTESDPSYAVYRRAGTWCVLRTARACRCGNDEFTVLSEDLVGRPRPNHPTKGFRAGKTRSVSGSESARRLSCYRTGDCEPPFGSFPVDPLGLDYREAIDVISHRIELNTVTIDR